MSSQPERKSMGRKLAGLGFAFAAPLALFLAMSNATILVFLGGGWNGFQRALLALNFITVPDPKKAQVQVAEPGINLAHKAYALEPLATDALFVIAIDAENSGQRDRARKIVDLGLELNKRDSRLQTLVLQREMAAGDIRAVFAALGRITLVKPELADPMVHALAPIVKDNVATPVLVEALSKNPVWAEAFWSWAPIEPLNLPNLVRLRKRLSAGTTESSDEYLISQLVANGFYDDALAILSRGGRTSAGKGSITSAPNLGWQQNADANFNMQSTGRGSFSLYAKPGTAGILGRELVALEPGSYRLDFNANSPDIAGKLRFALRCADGVAPDAAISLTKSTRWTVSERGCRAFWLAVGAETWDNSSAIVGNLTDVRLEKSGS